MEMCDDVERQGVPESSSSHEKLQIAKKLQEMNDSDTTTIPDRTLVISDEGLRMLASGLHYLDWRKLAILLGFSAGQISDFEIEKPHHIFQMLLTWRQLQDANTDQLRTLSEKLMQVGLVDLADTLLERYQPRSKPISNETTPHQKMASLPTDKACQVKGSEVQRSHEPSYLQLVLDEVHKATENLTENERLERRLQLPYIALGYFNEKGGSLSLDEYGVHLTIPRGAIASGSAQQVYIYVDPTAQQDDAVDEPSEVALSCNVECGPDGLTFAESLVLSFPHYADVKSTNPETLGPQMCQDKDLSGTWQEFDGNAVITEDRVILLVKHFTRFNLSGRSNKRLLVVPYGDAFDPSHGKYQFRVHVLHDDKKAKRNVEKDEQNAKRLDTFRRISWAKGNLQLAVTPSKFPDAEEFEVFEEKTQTIHEKKIKEHASNSVTFTLVSKSQSPKNLLYCAVEAYQRCEDEDSTEQNKVRFSICPQIKTTGKDAVERAKRGAACCQMVSPASQLGPTAAQTSMTLQEEVSRCFSERQPSDSGDAVGTYSDLYKQVQGLFGAENANGDNVRRSGTVNGAKVIVILNNGAEKTPSFLHQISTELHRVQELETKERRSRQEVISDATLRTLARQLGSEWEHLATLLGFGKHDIFKFRNDDPHSTANQIFSMLVSWRDEQYLEEQVDLLRKELRKVEKGDIAAEMRDIDDQSLRMVSEQLGTSWTSLAKSLGVGIERKYNSFKTEKKFQMLVKWRDMMLSQEVQVGKLCTELKSVEKEELADELKKELHQCRRH